MSKGRTALPPSLKNTKLLLNPESLTQVPDCPIGLDTFAKTCWIFIAKLMVQEQILTAMDLPALQSLCVWYSLNRRFESMLSDAESDLFEFPRRITQALEVSKHFLALSEHFGLTPKARGKVGLKSPTAEIVADAFQQFIQREKTLQLTDKEVGL